MHKERRLIGNLLLAEKVLTSEGLEKALAYQAEHGGYLCTAIVRLHLATARTVFEVLARQLGVKYCDLTSLVIDPAAVARVPARVAMHYLLMPISLDRETLTVALADPFDIVKLDDLRVLFDCTVDPVLAFEDDILRAQKVHYGVGADIMEKMAGLPQDKAMREAASARRLEDTEQATEDASIIGFINQLITKAVADRATDIHIEPYERASRIRFRIDGFLYEIPIPEDISLYHAAMISRIKIMSGLDIAEHRIPQDGRFKKSCAGVDSDFRVSVLPSSYGESAQIRVLGARSFLGFEELGLDADDIGRMQKIIEKPHGVIFVTGPTGSGKSTLLYAALQKKNKPDVKIITTEDPIENRMFGVTQIQVNQKAGLTFAESLRSILRHDPDVIMVGEVRDSETAEITIRSAMTGHLVFSTIHTNDAASTPIRLIDMGIEPFLVASSLEALIALRLVRRLCPHCAVPSVIPSSLFRENGIDVSRDSVEVKTAVGCDRCRNTGYQGRLGIFEIMDIDDEIRDLIFARATGQRIKEAALAKGMKTLRKDGLLKVLRGLTTAEEIMRVT